MPLPPLRSLLSSLRPNFPVLAALGISLWGCMIIHSATANSVGASHFALRQLAWVVVGAIAFVVARAIPFAVYRRHILWFAGLPYLALWLVLVGGIRINGMRGWFAWHGLFCQPSEMAKPVFVLASVLFLAWWRERDVEKRPGILPVAICALAWLIPVGLQPDFGAILVYALTLAVLYWCLGGRLRHLLLGVGVAITGAALVLWRYPYVQRRFVAFLDPEKYASGSGWHLMQFRRSLAAGGWFGHSWEMGSWSRAYLPLGHSDSVFASLAEQVGFVGLFPLLVLVLAWVVYTHRRACACQQAENAAVILGLGAIVGVQAFIHLSVNLGLLPPTGITLPLVSYGGSSLVATMVVFGMVESAWRDDPAQSATVSAVIAVDERARS